MQNNRSFSIKNHSFFINSSICSSFCLYQTLWNEPTVEEKAGGPTGSGAGFSSSGAGGPQPGTGTGTGVPGGGGVPGNLNDAARARSNSSLNSRYYQEFYEISLLGCGASGEVGT